MSVVATLADAPIANDGFLGAHFFAVTGIHVSRGRASMREAIRQKRLSEMTALEKVAGSGS